MERVKVKLGWNEGGVHVQFEGVIDVGSSKGPRIKRTQNLDTKLHFLGHKI